MNNWRLIIHPPYNGAWNMAVDEAILESTASKLQLPTLRLYDWHPYALSLGHAQPVSDINLQVLKKKHWDLVRRPTGGKSILHADEITYSVCAPVTEKLIHGSVLESYQKISKALLKSLENINLHADSKPKNKETIELSKNPVCFQYPSDYEITFQGRKIIGSAQARKKNGLLQHGAIPLFGDITRIIDVLSFSDLEKKKNAKIQLIQHASTIKDSLGFNPGWFNMAESICKGFEDTMGIKFVRSPLSSSELSRALEIYREKYSNTIWTLRI